MYLSILLYFVLSPMIDHLPVRMITDIRKYLGVLESNIL